MRIDHIADHPALVETVARWQWAEWGHLDPDDSPAAWIANLRAQTERGSISTTYLALERGELLGIASMVEDDFATHPEFSPRLACVYVKPDARGRGVASALVRQVVRVAATIGVQRLYLYTKGARGLYEKLGWQIIATEHVAGSPITIMAIDIR